MHFNQSALSCRLEVALKRLDSLVFQVRQVVFESLKFHFVSLVIGFAPQKLVSLVGQREGSEPEGLDGVREVAVLSLLGVLIHAVSDNVEVDSLTLLSLHDEPITLAVPMREHNLYETIGHELQVHRTDSQDILSESISDKSLHQPIHTQF